MQFILLCHDFEHDSKNGHETIFLNHDFCTKDDETQYFVIVCVRKI